MLQQSNPQHYKIQQDFASVFQQLLQLGIALKPNLSSEFKIQATKTYQSIIKKSAPIGVQRLSNVLKITSLKQLQTLQPFIDKILLAIVQFYKPDLHQNSFWISLLNNKFKVLKKLMLTDCNIQSLQPLRNLNLSQLILLYIDFNLVTNIKILSLLSLQNLISLSVIDNPVFDYNSIETAHFSKLERIHIEHSSPLCSNDLHWLVKIQSKRSLKISNNLSFIEKSLIRRFGNDILNTV